MLDPPKSDPIHPNAPLLSRPETAMIFVSWDGKIGFFRSQICKQLPPKPAFPNYRINKNGLSTNRIFI